MRGACHGAESSGRATASPGLKVPSKASVKPAEPRTTNQFISPNLFISEGIRALNGLYLKHLNAVFTLVHLTFSLMKK
jgi:hypothetical protein